MGKRFVINSLGEVFKGDECISGTATYSDLPKKVQAKPSDADWQKFFQKQVRASKDLTEKQKVIVLLVWKAQGKLNNSRVRVNYYDSAIRVNTEFRAPVENVEFWKKLAAVAMVLGAKIDTMDERVEDDSVTHTMGKKAGTVEYGPNHGKVMRQVDVNIPVKELSLTAIRKVYERLARVTLPLFKEQGINII